MRCAYNGTHCGRLPVYSDRIAQDLHLIPFYPAGRSRLQNQQAGTEALLYKHIQFTFTAIHILIQIHDQNDPKWLQIILQN